MFSSAAAFFTRSLKALVALVTALPCYGALEIVVFDWLIDWLIDCYINRHVVFHNSINLSSNSSFQNSICRQTRQNTSYMTSWPTNWVNWATTFRTDLWQLFTLWTCRQLDVELSWVESRRVGVAIDTSPTQLNSTRRRVELCCYKRPFKNKQYWAKQSSPAPSCRVLPPGEFRVYAKTS